MLNTDPLSVVKVSIDYGTPTDNAVIFEEKTNATKLGKYSIYVYSPPQQAVFESSKVIP